MSHDASEPMHQAQFPTPRLRPNSQTSVSDLSTWPLPTMPETDKHAAAQQAVDMLHEISTILVRLPGPDHNRMRAHTNSHAELPS